MDEKGKNVIVVIVVLIIAIAFGYVVMYIKTPSEKQISPKTNETVEDINIESLNFSHYLYDIDGVGELYTIAKISDNNVVLNINGEEFTLSNFGNPLSVRVAHVVKDTEYNIIYVLTTTNLFYLSDIEYMSATNEKLKPVFNKVDIDDVDSLAIVTETDKTNDYKYPTVYLKTKNKNIYVSKFGSEFSEYNK